MSFQCDGCGETHPLDPSLAVSAGSVRIDGATKLIEGVRFCGECAVFLDGREDSS